MNKKLTAAATAGLLVASGGFMSQAMAEQGFSYDYGQGGLLITDDGDDTDFGLDFRGSFAFTDDFFGYARLVPWMDESDFINLSIGPGYNFAVTPEMDLYGMVTLEHTDNGVDDQGFGITGGARYAVAPGMEAGGSLKFTTWDDGDNDPIDLTGYFLTEVAPQMDVVGEITFDDITDEADSDEFTWQMMVGARYNF
ncbi:hypothetical protein LRD18_04405 [Halorhodospira halochloris]|uniref:hypothetical protein n=1 Tax=Halorhodospira halochloris TaxID=1052 RepID=UPI001EE927E9|nr:hypothetical protein [Halorhodospira halochloris]MCG5530114.1 hypothetical protein [Halorhodospira halochloris]